MSEWREVKLGDICTELSDGLHKAPLFVEGGDYIFVNAKNLCDGVIVDNDPTKKTTHEEYLKYSKPLNDNTILFSIDGTIGNIARYKGEKCVLGKGACYINPNPFLADSSYIYFQLQSPHFKSYLNCMSTGSTIKHISLKTMRNYEFALPSLSEQRSIASILSSLDDKIAVNRRICENLEAQAQALFKHWFIDFAPFKNGKFVESELGMIPEGWRVCKLGSFFPIKTGKKDANIATATGQYPFFSCSQNVLTTDVFSFDGSAILVAGNGDFNVKWYEGKFEAYQRTYVLMPYESSYTHFLFYAIQYNLREITCGAGGTVIKFIRKADLENFKIAIPQELDKCDVLSVFSEINKNIANISTESNSLSTLRDTLLPKLMSGQIKV